MFGEKVGWELHYDSACCFEQILEAVPNKTAAQILEAVLYKTAAQILEAVPNKTTARILETVPYKTAAQILEAVPYKTAVVWSFTSHLTIHPSKTSKTWWTLMDKPIRNTLLWTPTHGHTCIGRLTKTYIHQFKRGSF